MSIEHLTENQIQTYLDNKAYQLDIEVKKHLADCHRCRKVLQQYHVVFASLKQEPEIILSSAFFATTMEKIKEEENNSRSFNISFILSGFFLFLFYVAATTYFVNIKGIVETVENFSLWDIITNFSVVTNLLELSGKYEGSLFTLLLVGIVLIFVAVADQLLLRHKLSKINILSI